MAPVLLVGPDREVGHQAAVQDDHEAEPELDAERVRELLIHQRDKREDVDAEHREADEGHRHRDPVVAGPFKALPKGWGKESKRGE